MGINRDVSKCTGVRCVLEINEGDYFEARKVKSDSHGK